MLKRILRPTNRRIRLAVGLLIAGLFCIQCTRTEAFKESTLVQSISGKDVGRASSNDLAAVEHLAKTNHIALLERCLEHYQGRYEDYTCTFIKQEKIHGKLKDEQWIDVKFMDTPFSVALDWKKNAPIGEAVLYVEGKYDDKMLVRPRGFLNALVGTQMRKPDGPEAMQNTLRPVNMFGFERAIENLLKVYREADENGDLEEAYGGYADVAGRKAVALIRYLPPTHDYPAYKTIVYIDAERMVPVCIEGYDWDEQITSRYIYKDVNFNVGLTPDDFLPEANEMKDPT